MSEPTYIELSRNEYLNMTRRELTVVELPLGQLVCCIGYSHSKDTDDSGQPLTDVLDKVIDRYMIIESLDQVRDLLSKTSPTQGRNFNSESIPKSKSRTTTNPALLNLTLEDLLND